MRLSLMQVSPLFMPTSLSLADDTSSHCQPGADHETLDTGHEKATFLMRRLFFFQPREHGIINARG